MTDKEKEVLLSYLVNQGIRYDNDVEFCKSAIYLHPNSACALSLLRSVISKQVFDKLAHDLSALLGI